jgi:predicted Rossmann fold flavoprotein
MTTPKIAIIGSGPAGLMTAAYLLEKKVQADIFLFEKSAKIGGKILISGGGRCNLTTALADAREILAKYTRGANFLKHTINKYSSTKIREWFAGHGLKTKVEKDDKVFPVSDSSESVLQIFEQIFQNQEKLKVLVNTEILDVGYDQNTHKFLIKTNTQNEIMVFDYLIIATGGSSHERQLNGGYYLARKLGHTITRLAPSLTSFEVKESWVKELSGLSLTDCKISYISARGENKVLTGDLIFTHFGISGPAVFSLSSHIAYEIFDENKPFRINLIIDKNKQITDWDKLLVAEIEENGSRMIKNVLYKFLPNRLVDQILTILQIKAQKKAAEITREERRKIANILGNGIEIILTKQRAEHEMVTAGGVKLGEIDPKTCESKICSNLHFAGEILDIDGVTGGFNLQACWMTGMMAGEAISTRLSKS